MSGRIVNARPKQGFVMDSGGNVVPMRARDGLANVITGLGMRGDARLGRQYVASIMAPSQIEEAYEASWSLAKAIDIPAEDRVREWRDWQATKEQIELIEAEEERHNLQAKVQQAEVLRGLGGGALILISGTDPSQPLNVTAKGGLTAINVVSRYHLSGQNWNDNMATNNFGEPEYWEMNGAGSQTRLHPSRVVCFRGRPLPSIWKGNWEDRFWGRGRVPTLIEPAQNLDEALATFNAMIKDALNVDVGISKLFEMLAKPDGEATLMKRLALMQQGSSVFNGRVYDNGDGEGKGAEAVDRHQVDWTGIPGMISIFAEAMSAAADIPVTRFWGTASKGLNATGEGDQDNWDKMVMKGQKLETRPCLLKIDAALIPSALGSRPSEIWWKFAPLSEPTDAEETDRFKKWTEAAEKVQLTGAVPDVAFNEAYQNGLVENGWMPGLDAALDKVPESERFAGEPEGEPDQVDPNAETLPLAANDSFARIFTDATPRPLYVRRDLKPASAKALIAWAKSNGFTSTLEASDMHVTILYSRQPVDPMKMGETWGSEPDGGLVVKAGGPRAIERFGEGAVVLQFASWSLASRHDDMVRAGASHDYEDYLPHVTITYAAPEGLDLDAIKPFTGELAFGPEIFSPLEEDWKAKIEEN